LLAEEILGGQAKAIINRVIELARNGDLNYSAALKETVNNKKTKKTLTLFQLPDQSAEAENLAFSDMECSGGS
jgi:post-segregation antitoxin (ccd killing protein)